MRPKPSAAGQQRSTYFRFFGDLASLAHKTHSGVAGGYGNVRSAAKSSTVLPQGPAFSNRLQILLCPCGIRPNEIQLMLFSIALAKDAHSWLAGRGFKIQQAADTRDLSDSFGKTTLCLLQAHAAMRKIHLGNRLRHKLSH